MLADPSYDQAARRLQTEIAGHQPYEEIAAHVDELLDAAGSAAAGAAA